MSQVSGPGTTSCKPPPDDTLRINSSGVGASLSAGITMRALVDDILDVAKMETGNLTIEQAPFAIAIPCPFRVARAVFWQSTPSFQSSLQMTPAV